MSLLLVLALHAGLLLIIVLRRMPTEAIGMPPTAVMIDLAPAPAAAPAESTPPPPAEPEAQDLPHEPPKLAPSPAPHPEVALPAPPPKPKPKAKRIEHPPPPRRAEPTLPLREPAPAAPATPPAAAAQGSAAQSMSSTAAGARASWQAQLVAWLEKYKRYPRVAQEQHQQGVAYLRFAIDRQGRVLSSEINKSSGFPLLDEEVLALIQRAQPLPSPPPEVGGSRIDLQVPVAFSLRR